MNRSNPDVIEVVCSTSNAKTTLFASKHILWIRPQDPVETPSRQSGYFYAFARVVPGPIDILRWDSDQRLQTAIALSRLVRPTSISFRNARRVLYNEDGSIVQAFPAWL